MNLIVCPEIHAAKAGHDIFGEGGNAIDAALCAAFVQGVTNHLLCGIGGTISIYVYASSTRKDVYLNGEEVMGSGSVPAEWAAELLPGRAEASGRYRLRSRANDVGYHLAAERCISLCSLLAAGSLFALAEVEHPWPVFLGALGFWFFMIPVFTLTTAAACLSNRAVWASSNCPATLRA